MFLFLWVAIFSSSSLGNSLKVPINVIITITRLYTDIETFLFYFIIFKLIRKNPIKISMLQISHIVPKKFYWKFKNLFNLKKFFKISFLWDGKSDINETEKYWMYSKFLKACVSRNCTKSHAYSSLHHVTRIRLARWKLNGTPGREGGRELPPSTRIQITSSNATSATTTTLAGAILYAKRSCNPALARGACAGVHVARERAIARVFTLARVHACVWRTTYHVRFADILYDMSRRVRTCIRAQYGMCSL